MKQRAITLVAIAVLFGLSSQARAGLVISFENISPIAVGGNATLDVVVTAQGDTDINLYDVTFTIERLSGSGDLTFVNPQNPSYRTAMENFVFGDSWEPSTEVFSTPSGGVANQRYATSAVNSLGGPFEDVTLGSDLTYLLARLQLTANDLTAVGSVFQISISSAFYESEIESSEFIVPLDPIRLTVVQPVPEPSTLVSVATGIMFLSCWGLRRRRRTS